MKWTRTAFGWTGHNGLCRWAVRGPIMGKPMFWLYREGSRFTPTGRFADVVSFKTAREAKKYATQRGGLSPHTKG